jgi:hypothetical protein
VSPDDPRHGTYAGYHQHVRREHETACQPCLDAAARYERGRQLDLLNGTPRRVPSTGPRRKAQALIALGHTFVDVAAAANVHTQTMHRFTHGTTPNTTIRLTKAINAAYDALSMKLPDEHDGHKARRAREARELAARLRWPVPLAWEGVDINDPRARPYSSHQRGPRHDDVDPVLVERVLSGDMTVARAATTAERRLIVAAWTNRTGRPLADLERGAGWKPERYKNRPTTTPTTKENTAA